MSPSRINRIRPKDTSRADARRRHREEQRELEAAPDAPEDQIDVDESAAPKRGMLGMLGTLAMPNVLDDIKALPQVFKNPLVWLPFGLLLLAFGLELARQAGAFPEGQVGEIATLYIQLTLPPTSLFVFFIGGFVASRASYMVGALLGIFDALLITILFLRDETALAGSGVTEITGDQSTLQALVPLWGIAILVGVFAAGFASWYRRFLRSSQERAKRNRAIKEQDQAKKAKEQARADKEEARKSRRNLSD